MNRLSIIFFTMLIFLASASFALAVVTQAKINPKNLNPNDGFNLECTVSSSEANKGCVKATNECKAGVTFGCSFLGWSGNTAKFNCVAPPNPGSYFGGCWISAEDGCTQNKNPICDAYNVAAVAITGTYAISPSAGSVNDSFTFSLTFNTWPGDNYPLQLQVFRPTSTTWENIGTRVTSGNFPKAGNTISTVMSPASIGITTAGTYKFRVELNSGSANPTYTNEVTINLVAATPSQQFATLSGKVIDSSTQSAISGAVISYQTSSNLIISTTTDSNGFYIFQSLVAGTYNFITTALGYSQQSKTLTLTAGQNSTLNFELQPLATNATPPPPPPSPPPPSPQLTIQCGDCQANSVCQCSLNTACQNGEWWVRSKPGQKTIVDTKIEAFTFGNRTVNFKPTDNGTVEVRAICFNPVATSSVDVNVKGQIQKTNLLSCPITCDANQMCECKISSCSAGNLIIKNKIGSPLSSPLLQDISNPKFTANANGTVKVKLDCDNPQENDQEVEVVIKFNVTKPITTGIFDVSSFSCSLSAKLWKCSLNYKNGLGEDVNILFILSDSKGKVVNFADPSLTASPSSTSISKDLSCNDLGKGSFKLSWKAYKSSDPLKPFKWSDRSQRQIISC